MNETFNGVTQTSPVRPVAPLDPQALHVNHLPAQPVSEQRFAFSAGTYLVILFTFLVLGIFLLRTIGHRTEPSPATAAAGPTQPRPAQVQTKQRAADMTVQARTLDATNYVMPPTPKPDPFQVQAIFFSPARPSAIVGGKTVFVGDQLGWYVVMSIGRDKVTIRHGDRERILYGP